MVNEALSTNIFAVCHPVHVMTSIFAIHCGRVLVKRFTSRWQRRYVIISYPRGIMTSGTRSMVFSLPCIILCLFNGNCTSGASLNVNNSTSSSIVERRLGDSCWEVNGALELTCFHPESLGDEDYPLTLDMLDRSIPYETSDLQLHRAFQIAHNKGVLQTVIIGGKIIMAYIYILYLLCAECFHSKQLIIVLNDLESI